MKVSPCTCSVKPQKQRSIRRRRQSSSSDSEEETTVDLAVVKEIQNLRKRPKGLSAEELATAGARLQEKETPGNSGDGDVFKMAGSGGMVDMKQLAKQKQQEDFGKTFEVETNRRDEDANMIKFIEKELAKRRGADVEDEATKNKRLAKSNLFEGIDERLRPTIAKRPEGMLSAQMLMGIPEVDLGVQEKIRNIEATEDAKQKMVTELVAQRAQQNQESDLVPANMAVNFVQHSRWNNAETEKISAMLSKVQPAKEESAKKFRVGDFEKLSNEEDVKKSLTSQKSSDDLCFNKFRSQEMEKRKK